jgi:starch-binding outer membrane protein, SusD/RagB family
MRKKIYISFVLSLTAMLIGGCEKVLDQVPESEITEASFFKNRQDAEAATIGCYSPLITMANNYMQWGDSRSDNTILGTIAGNFRDFTDNKISADIGDVNWAVLYNIINRCNLVIERVPTIEDITLTPALRNQFIGEAHFLRGFCYFTLVRNWGDVPVLLTPSTTVDRDYKLPRTPRVKVLEQAESDLLAAESLIPPTFKNKSRGSVAGARGLLAKLYLWRAGTEANSSFYNKVVDYANLVIADPAYALVAGTAYATLYADGANTSEAIFEVNVKGSRAGGGGLSNLTQTYLPTASNPTGGNNRLLPSQKLVSAYEPNDRRRPVTLRLPGENPEGFTSNGFPTTSTVIYQRKYTGTLVAAAREGDDNYIILRTADVILMKAEALNEISAANVTDVRTLVNQIRTRAGLGATPATTQATLRDAIDKERFVELAFEGDRWYDLVRTNRLTSAFAGYPEFQNRGVNEKKLLPVSALEIFLNPNLLPQNAE